MQCLPDMDNNPAYALQLCNIFVGIKSQHCGKNKGKGGCG